MIQEGRRYAIWLGGNTKRRLVTVSRVQREDNGATLFFDTVERPGRWVAWKTVDAYQEVGRNERA